MANEIDTTTETPETPDNVFEIPEENVTTLFEKLAKLNRRAAKLDCPLVACEEIARELRPYHRCDNPDRCSNEYCEVSRLWITFRIEGAAPKLAGWEFVASLSHEQEGGVFISAVPGESIPVEFRNVRPGRCDHCNAVRRRRDTFVVRNEETGEHKVVGRQCVADFLGGQDPKRIASYLTALWVFMAGLGDEEGFGGGGSYVYHWDVERMLAVASMFVRTCGWLGRSKAREWDRHDATADLTLDHLIGPGARATAEEWELFRANEAAISGSDQDKARKILWWAGETFFGRTDLSDYEHNLVVALSGSVTAKTLGVAASAVVAYDRAMVRLAERKARENSPSRHLHAPGKRFDFKAEVTMVRWVEGDYGTTTVLKFRDSDGNVLTWFASGSKDIEVGQSFAIRATVKKHDNYRGEDQTVITRAKLTELAT
jgi:hypothetical protein